MKTDIQIYREWGLWEIKTGRTTQMFQRERVSNDNGKKRDGMCAGEKKRKKREEERYYDQRSVTWFCVIGKWQWWGKEDGQGGLKGGKRKTGKGEREKGNNNQRTDWVT